MHVDIIHYHAIYCWSQRRAAGCLPLALGPAFTQGAPTICTIATPARTTDKQAWGLNTAGNWTSATMVCKECVASHSDKPVSKRLDISYFWIWWDKIICTKQWGTSQRRMPCCLVYNLIHTKQLKRLEGAIFHILYESQKNPWNLQCLSLFIPLALFLVFSH